MHVLNTLLHLLLKYSKNWMEYYYTINNSNNGFSSISVSELLFCCFFSSMQHVALPKLKNLFLIGIVSTSLNKIVRARMNASVQ